MREKKPRSRTKRAGTTSPKAPKAAPEARDGVKAPDAREASRLAAWEAPPADASDDGEVFGDEDSMHMGGVPSPHWCSEADGYNEALNDLMGLSYRFARLARLNGDESTLVAARILDGLFACLESKRSQRDKIDTVEMGRAASILNRVAHDSTAKWPPKGRLPANLGTYKRAAVSLAEVVRRAIEGNHDVALWLEMARTNAYAHLGALAVLPYDGAPKDRIALFAKEIEKLRLSSGGGKIDPEAVVSACAHACGNSRELFGSLRKSVKRTGHE